MGWLRGENCSQRGKGHRWSGWSQSGSLFFGGWFRVCKACGEKEKRDSPPGT